MKKFVKDTTPRRKRGKSTAKKSFGSRDDSSRGFGSPRSRNSRSAPKSRRELPPVQVICSSCGSSCEVPFKPTSDKPVYCDQCFASKGKKHSSKSSNDDLAALHAKLDKIMRALDIE